MAATTTSDIPSETDILICGAGPAGLAAALSAHFHSPESRLTIVDALTTGQNESRALVVHARTLEALDTIECAGKLSSEGLLQQRTSLQTPSYPLIQANFVPLAKWTKFPYMLIMSQAHTEAIFTQALQQRGITIHRPYKVVAIKELDYKSGFVVTFDNGKTISCKYIVGADGSRSTVRSFSGIQFQEPSPGRNLFLRLISKPMPMFVVVDMKFESPLPEENPLLHQLTLTFTDKGFFLFAVLVDHLDENGKDDCIYRIAFFVEKDEEERARNIAHDLDFLTGKLKRAYRYYTPQQAKSNKELELPKVRNVVWTSTFRIRYALAETFFKQFSNGGHLILAGDAAHVHSPAGGQGMNMGICDGVEAGAAIAAHIQSGDLNHLEVYAQRRRAIAEDTIRVTKVLSWLGTMTSPWSTGIRNWIMWGMGKFSKVRGNAAWQLSGLKYLNQS